MSQENVDLFWEGADAFRRGDVDAILDVVSEDVVWIAARSAVEGAYHGHEGIRRFLADTAVNFEVFEPGFDEVRDLVIASWRSAGPHPCARERRGDQLSGRGHATYRDGKLVGWADFGRPTALEAVGLSE